MKHQYISNLKKMNILSTEQYFIFDADAIIFRYISEEYSTTSKSLENIIIRGLFRIKLVLKSPSL